MILWLIKKYSLLLREAFLSTLFCLLLTYLLSLIFLNLSFLNPFKEAFKDFSLSDIYYSENIQESTINKDIILINIERRNRYEVGLLLETILAENPKVIGVDALFRELKDSISDDFLSKKLQHRKVVNAINIKGEEIIENHPLFKTKNEAFININFNGENVIRTFNAQHEKDSSFALKIAHKFNPSLGFNSNKEQNRIKYNGNYKSFLHFGFDEFMLLPNKNILRNKIVILGYLGTPLGNQFDVEDKFFTPLNTKTSGKSLPDMFGVVIHANIIKMFIEQDYIYEVSNFTTLLFSFFSVFIFMIFVILLEKRGEIYNRTFKWLVLFLYTACLLYLHLILYSNSIYLNVFIITATTIIASNMFIFYVHFIKFLKNKISWKSYLNT